ncbi:hypothetical protein [Arthrobacter sp. B1805]|uniref:hypothetical protein n=1 Tax=Arthrobacter sp. B1805 TaxID=2058892 RepID=UPI000CE4F3F5|nr:hypothetical protein [Arthrobacter sp. B1805]
MSTSITEQKRRPRVTTIVWGALILAIALLVLLSQFIALSIDPVVVALGLLIGVGLALVAGGILSLRSRATADGGGTDRSANEAGRDDDSDHDRDHGSDTTASY